MKKLLWKKPDDAADTNNMCWVMVAIRSAPRRCQNPQSFSLPDTPERAAQYAQSQDKPGLCGAHRVAARRGRKLTLLDGHALNPEGQTVLEFEQSRIQRVYESKLPVTKHEKSSERCTKPENHTLDERKVVPEHMRTLIYVFEVECRGSTVDAARRLNMSLRSFAAQLALAREEYGL